MERSRLHGLLCDFIKQSAYVRGYLPELLSHATPYTGTPPKPGKGVGKLALVGAIAAGAYFLYNKYMKNKQKEETEDDKNYSNVPPSVMASGPSTSLMDWDRNYTWSDDDEDDYDYDIPPAIPDNVRYGGGAAPMPEPPESVKTSAMKMDKVKQWLYK